MKRKDLTTLLIQENAELRASNAELRALVAKQAAIIVKLEARIAELERRLNLDSSNSSKPPSSDGLQKKPAPQSLRENGKLKSGGQEGHTGHTLKQVSNPDHIIIHEVKACISCNASLANCPTVRYIKRQVFDIPEPHIEVTEHQAAVTVCACGQHNTAEFPAEVTAPVQYGNLIKTLTVYFSNEQHIPEDRLQILFLDVFKLTISTATLVEISRTFSKLVAPIQERVLELLKAAFLKHLDETGFRINGKTSWLHSISNDLLTHYRPSLKRGDISKGLRGIVVHDHWKPYFTLEKVLHALCNAHHLRELKALAEIEKEVWAIQMARLLNILNRMKDPPIERMFRIYDDIVNRGLAFHESQPPLSARKNKRRTGHNLLLRLKNYKDAVLRFLTTPGVPFTNNQAEQDIRMMKVKQKISGGFRTMQGAETFCTIRGFLSTCRKHGLNLFQAIMQSFAGNHPNFRATPTP